jgi:hypothetical protein
MGTTLAETQSLSGRSRSFFFLLGRRQKEDRRPLSLAGRAPACNQPPASSVTRPRAGAGAAKANESSETPTHRQNCVRRNMLGTPLQRERVLGGSSNAWQRLHFRA